MINIGTLKPSHPFSHLCFGKVSFFSLSIQDFPSAELSWQHLGSSFLLLNNFSFIHSMQYKQHYVAKNITFLFTIIIIYNIGSVLSLHNGLYSPTTAPIVKLSLNPNPSWAELALFSVKGATAGIVLKEL